MTEPLKTITGKTTGILSRLPHFFNAEEAGGLLAAFADIFGRRLERAESDLYRVLHAHHVETADNEGFQGYTAPPEKRGDLDKIFALYLEALGGTALLVKVNPRFTVRSMDARRMAALLVRERNALIEYLGAKFALKTWKLILRYDIERMKFKATDIQPGFALALLLGRTSVASHIRARLTPETQKLLAEYTGSPELNPLLCEALAIELNERILRDASLFRKNEDELRALNLPPGTVKLINSVYHDYLYERYKNQANAAQQLQALANAEPAETPLGSDVVRLNRLLLEAAFPESDQTPWGFHPRGVPALEEIRAGLVDEFNKLLDDPHLYSEERFPDLVEDYPHLQTHYKDQLVWLNRVLLESVFTSELEKSYAPYRERLRGLIRVLRNGASTRQGIMDIVAANLGIVGDDPQVRAAKALISVEEYNPQRTHFFNNNVGLYQEFDVNNSNPADETPEIWLTMLAMPATTPGGPVRALGNVRFVDVATRREIRVSTRIQPGDTLVFTGNSVLLNGIAAGDLPIGNIPTLKGNGISRWRFEADIISLDDGNPAPVGLFDQTNFGESLWATDEPVVSVEVLSYRYTPGVFKVVIPWHIPGFTDKFAETDQHPRHQILGLVNRVKAAGVLAQVAYKQVIPEDQNQLDRLGLQLTGKLLSESHQMDDKLWASNTQQSREDQNISDKLSLRGHFDITSFDSLNSFD